MISLNAYIEHAQEKNIFEALTKKQTSILGSTIVTMLQGINIPADVLTKMFMNLELDIIQQIEEYISETDPENSIAYVSDKDEFLKEENKQDIVDKLVKYFYILK